MIFSQGFVSSFNFNFQVQLFWSHEKVQTLFYNLALMFCLILLKFQLMYWTKIGFQNFESGRSECRLSSQSGILFTWLTINSSYLADWLYPLTASPVDNQFLKDFVLAKRICNKLFLNAIFFTPLLLCWFTIFCLFILNWSYWEKWSWILSKPCKKRQIQ